MTTYNTGNPVPSADARDRYDNSQTLDEVVNGDSASYTTRTGKQVISIGGMNSRFNNDQDARESAFNLSQEEKQEAFQSFLDGTGWSSLGAYGAGVAITSHTQTVDYQGQPYQLKPSIPASLDAPYVTTGVWATEGVNFKLVGDNSLRQDLADTESGAENIGFDNQTLSDWLVSQGYWRTIEYFGPVNTPASTKNTMQLAINWCAANGYVLRASSRTYTIDVSVSGITIPDNFICDLSSAWIIRATGNQTPHDMWVNADAVNGNTGISIQGVRFNGKAQVDSLTNANPAHRFCGLRLIKCEGRLLDVRADATCNGEIQTEGTRGGIMLQESVFMDCENLRTDNTIGTGLFIRGGLGRLHNFQGNANTGSGMSGDQPGWIMSALSSKVSGYSGISLNGPGWVAHGVYASGAPIGYAGINLGHAGAGNGSVDAVAGGFVAENNAGWGINATASPGLQGDGWVSKNSGAEGVRLVNSPGSTISVLVKGGSSHGLLVDGAGTYAIDANISGAAFNGLYARNGADVVLSAGSVLSGNSQGGAAAAFTAGVTVDTSSKVEIHGRVLDGAAYGVQSTGAGIISIEGGSVRGNASGDIRTSGGVVRFDRAKLSADVRSGTFTILAGTNNVATGNGNMIDPNLVVFTPANAAARTAGMPMISTFVPQSSFTAQISANAASDAQYRYVLL